MKSIEILGSHVNDRIMSRSMNLELRTNTTQYYAANLVFEEKNLAILRKSFVGLC
jgi:hypothetical protein